MTEGRYWQVRGEYGIASSHFPTVGEIAGMTEDGLRESLEAVRAIFDEPKKKRNKDE